MELLLNHCNVPYTVSASEKFDNLVDTHMKEILQRVLALPQGKDIVAIILLGGYGRGEGTALRKNGEELPYNDYDLIVVGKRRLLFCRKLMQEILHGLEKNLSQDIGIPVDLYFHTVDTLRFAEFSLLNLELRNGHRVLWGPADILDLMPTYSLMDLPLSEGTRLLLNRGALLFIAKMYWYGKKISESEQEDYLKYLMKAHLAFGDCSLMLAQAYDISYVEKRKRIKGIKTSSLPSLSWMQEMYVRAIDFKLNGDFSVYAGVNPDELFEQTAGYYCKFFDYFEAKRLQVPVNSVEDYIGAYSFNEALSWSLPKDLVKNLRQFGTKSMEPYTHWACLSPRTRLFASIRILLDEKATEEQKNLVKELLGTRAKPDDIGAIFLDLWGKFS